MTAELMDFDVFFDKVVDYLEYIDYPSIVMEFEPSSIAESIGPTIKHFYEYCVSVRLTAITIFSLTMNYQIIPQSKKEVRH